MTDRAVVSHVLRRLTFGPTAAEVDAAVTAGLDATVRRLLTPPAPATPIDLGADPAAALPKGATREDRIKARQAVAAQVSTLTWWWFTRMIAADSAAAEKLVFFWHGHWATSVQKVRSATLMLTQQQTFRRYGTGDTGPLVRAMLRDPALILWLDGQKNTRTAPNENLARELMELFTLGVGHYTEDDVKAGARVLTGWQVNRAKGTATLLPRRHDPAAVSLLGHTSALDVDGYADLLVQHPAHRPFLAARLWARYGSDEPAPAATAARMAAAGRSAPAMLTALATDPAFPATAGHLVKQPIEWLAGAVRQLNIDASKLDEKQHKQVLAGLRMLGQVPLRPPSVGGWPAGAAWLTTSSAEGRIKAGIALTALAPAAVATLAGAPASERLDALAHLLVVDRWTDRTAAALKTAAGEPKRLLALGLATPEYTVH